MGIKDFVGLVFIAAGVTVATLGYRIMGFEWYFGGSALLSIGLGLIWSASRDRSIIRALLDGLGDGGDRRFTSGGHAEFDCDNGDD